MKITVGQVRRLIREEIRRIDEADDDDWSHWKYKYIPSERRTGIEDYKASTEAEVKKRLYGDKTISDEPIEVLIAFNGSQLGKRVSPDIDDEQIEGLVHYSRSEVSLSMIQADDHAQWTISDKARNAEMKKIFIQSAVSEAGEECSDVIKKIATRVFTLDDPSYDYDKYQAAARERKRSGGSPDVSKKKDELSIEDEIVHMLDSLDVYVNDSSDDVSDVIRDMQMKAEDGDFNAVKALLKTLERKIRQEDGENPMHNFDEMISDIDSIRSKLDSI